MSDTHVDKIPAAAEENGWQVSATWKDYFGDQRVTFTKTGTVHALHDVLGVFDSAGKLVAAYRQDAHGVGVMRTTRVGDVYLWLTGRREQEK